MDKRQRIEDTFEKAKSFRQRAEKHARNALIMLLDEAGVPYEYRNYFDYSLSYGDNSIGVYYIWTPANSVNCRELIGLTANEIYKALGTTEEAIKKQLEEAKKWGC